MVVVVRLVVCGGKQFKDYDLLDRALSAVHQKKHIRFLIVGGLPGAETMAHEWACRTGIDTVITKPTQFDLMGRRSIALRNVTIFRELKPDGVVAFPGRTETEHMIHTAEEYKVTVWKVPPDWR